METTQDWPRLWSEILRRGVPERLSQLLRDVGFPLGPNALLYYKQPAECRDAHARGRRSAAEELEALCVALTRLWREERERDPEAINHARVILARIEASVAAEEGRALEGAEEARYWISQAMQSALAIIEATDDERVLHRFGAGYAHRLRALGAAARRVLPP